MPKPTDIERSEGIDLNGYMRSGYFECTKLQMKCPSKYKDDQKAAEKNLSTAATEEPKILKKADEFYRGTPAAWQTGPLLYFTFSCFFPCRKRVVFSLCTTTKRANER
jgi:hypothetical protein